MEIKTPTPNQPQETQLQAAAYDLPADLVTQFTAAVPMGFFHPSWVDFDAWAQVGRTFFKVDDNWRWVIGEWLRFGDLVHGEKASQLFPINYKSSSIRQARWMVDRIPPEERRYDSPNITYAHCVPLAAMDKETRNMWMDWIERQGPHGVSVGHLKNAINKHTLPPDTAEGRALLEQNQAAFSAHKHQMEAEGVPIDHYGVTPLVTKAETQKFDWDKPTPAPYEPHLLPEPLFRTFVSMLHYIEAQEGSVWDKEATQAFKHKLAQLAAVCKRHIEGKDEYANTRHL